MFEATLAQASVLKKLLDAAKELVTDANFECNEEGLNLQAMDNSHVALIAIKLNKDGFASYRCDHAMPLGVNLIALTKVLKCAKDDDKVTMRAENEADVLHLKFEADRGQRIAEYEMKLMDIDQDTLGIPDTDYDCKVHMPSGEFGRIVRELTALGESVRIEVNKEGISFNSEGDVANGRIVLKPTNKHEDKYSKKSNGSSSTEVKKEKAEDDEQMEEDDGGEIQEDEEGDQPARKKKKRVVSDNEDDAAAAPASDAEDNEEEESPPKKRKRKDNTGKATKKPKTGNGDDDDKAVSVSVTQAVALSFSLKYLVNFSKASGLCSHVELMLSTDVPLMCSYEFEQGHIQYYLAPKIGDE